MKISIIIVNYNLAEYIARLLESINDFLNDLDYEIIIVDNNSSDRNIENIIKNNKDIKFVSLNKNFGFGYANNRGMEIANGNYYLLLNPDTYLKDDSLKVMINEIKVRKDWGIVGPMVLYANGNIQESALHFPNIRYEVYTMFGLLSPIIRYSKLLRRKVFGNKEYETDFLFGSCLLIKKEVNDIINGFDEDYFLFSEETDYCYRAKKITSYKIIHYPKSCIMHEAGAVTKKKPLKRIYQNYNSKLIFILKHYKSFYSLLFRYTVILLFIKKLAGNYLFKKDKYQKVHKYYFNIIKIYKNKTPELNDIK